MHAQPLRAVQQPPWRHGGLRTARAAPPRLHCDARRVCDPRARLARTHRALTRTRRAWQFALAWLGTASLQKGPLWWCSHHRHHHRTADTPRDAHSPVAHGFWWSHCGWFLLTNRHAAPLLRAVPDLAALPEIRWLERHYLLPPAALAAALGAVGGARAVAYGFFVATVLCWHATYAINSVAHLLGGRRFTCEFNGACTARNNL
jgi:stearoyl-CoA desaturase (delta-9 desaturase)